MCHYKYNQVKGVLSDVCGRCNYETCRRLQERADLNKKISDLRGRLNQNSLVQEGERPNEDPTVLMQELSGNC